MRKILLLGGLSYFKPIIEVAHKLGIYVMELYALSIVAKYPKV